MNAADIDNLIGSFDSDKTYLLTGSELNKIKECFKRINPTGDNSTTRTQENGTDGTIIISSGGLGSTIFVDFSLYDAGGGLLGIKNGAVNGILPTGMTDGGSPAYTVDVTSTTGSAYIIVTATKLAGITSVTLGNGASIPADVVASGTGSGTYYLSLGDYSCDGVGVLTIGSGASGIGSQTFNLCRDWFTVDYSARWATA